MMDETPTQILKDKDRPITVGRKNWLFSDTPEGATANSKCISPYSPEFDK